MTDSKGAEGIRMQEWVDLYRKRNPARERWAAGYGPINHTVETQARVFAMAELLAARGVKGNGMALFDILYAVDRVASAAMWNDNLNNCKHEWFRRDCISWTKY